MKLVIACAEARFVGKGFEADGALVETEPIAQRRPSTVFVCTMRVEWDVARSVSALAPLRPLRLTLQLELPRIFPRFVEREEFRSTLLPAMERFVA